jgi:hypothetical protein
MTLLDLPIPDRPIRFHPEEAPPGVALQLDAFDRLNDGYRWKAFRPRILPTVGVVHTNAASREATVQSQINWGRSSRNNTKPHYCVNYPVPTKTLPTDLRGIGNSTGSAVELQHGVRDSSYWSYVIETADKGSIAARLAGYNWPIDCGPFLEDSVYGRIDVPHAEIVARIFAFEAITHGHALTIPKEFKRGMSGIVTHTHPFPYPHFTIVRGKTCPGNTKIWTFHTEIVDRAQQIMADWTKVPEPPKENDVYVPLTTPWRFDTRNGHGKLGKKQTITIPGVPGVPPDAVAVHANFTYVQAVGAGHVTVWGPGPKPNATILNYGLVPFAGCNAVNVSTMDDGSFKIYTLNSIHLIVDVFGYYKSAN